MLFYPEARANTCFLETSVVTQDISKEHVLLHFVHSKMCTFWFRVKKDFFKYGHRCTWNMFWTD
jgi:hypothetical protein